MFNSYVTNYQRVTVRDVNFPAEAWWPLRWLGAAGRSRGHRGPETRRIPKPDHRGPDADGGGHKQSMGIWLIWDNGFLCA